MKINDKVEMIINDAVLTGTVDTISTRETDRELWTYYTIKLDQANWSLSLSHLEEKKNENEPGSIITVSDNEMLTK